jgi:hypothetical protein
VIKPYVAPRTIAFEEPMDRTKIGSASLLQISPLIQ